MNTYNANLLVSIPPDVLAAAAKVSDYFAELNASDWMVNGIGPVEQRDKTLWGVVANARRRAPYGQRWCSLWVLVHCTTALGSTSSANLCRRFGFDPYSTRADTDKIKEVV